jgi:hypothetical protein
MIDSSSEFLNCGQCPGKTDRRKLWRQPLYAIAEAPNADLLQLYQESMGTLFRDKRLGLGGGAAHVPLPRRRMST